MFCITYATSLSTGSFSGATEENVGDMQWGFAARNLFRTLNPRDVPVLTKEQCLQAINNISSEYDRNFLEDTIHLIKENEVSEDVFAETIVKRLRRLTYVSKSSAKTKSCENETLLQKVRRYWV